MGFGQGWARRALVATALAASAAAQAQDIGGLSADEIERRNAAVGYALPKGMAVAVTRTECARLVPETEAIAQAWWRRTRDDMDAASAWSNRYLAALHARDPARQRAASAELLRASSSAMVDSVRTLFGQALPDADTCKRVLQFIEAGAVDVQVKDPRPEFARFKEFAQTLARIRAEPGYKPPEERFRTFAAQVPPTQMLASLLALEKAREARDGPGAVRVFTSMAERGDARAAQSLGLMYFRGDVIPRDPALAYRWFYRSHAMGNATGLNALGVAWRDGAGVEPDRKIAVAVFHLAAAVETDPAERERARANAGRLDADLTLQERTTVGCMRLRELEDTLFAPVADVPGMVRPGIDGLERRIGELVPELAASCS